MGTFQAHIDFIADAGPPIFEIAQKDQEENGRSNKVTKKTNLCVVEQISSQDFFWRSTWRLKRDIDNDWGLVPWSALIQHIAPNRVMTSILPWILRRARFALVAHLEASSALFVETAMQVCNLFIPFQVAL